MSHSSSFEPIRRTWAAGFIAALALAAGSACGGSASSSGTGGNAGLGAGGASAGSSNAGGSHSGGASGTGASNAGGSHSGGSSGTSSAGGSHSGGSSGTGALGGGGATSGDHCSLVTSEAACKARTDCQAIYGIIPCPGSGAACPTQFTYCSNSGCGPACNADSVCVKEQVSGGAHIPEDDAGACPQGDHSNGSGACERDPTYTCQSIPAGCNGTVSCACAQALCSGSCQRASQTQIDCLQLVP